MFVAWRLLEQVSILAQSGSPSAFKSVQFKQDYRKEFFLHVVLTYENVFLFPYKKIKICHSTCI